MSLRREISKLAKRDLNRHEAEFGADGTRVFRDDEERQKQPETGPFIDHYYVVEDLSAAPLSVTEYPDRDEALEAYFALPADTMKAFGVVNTPTNRVITSLCSPERLLFLLKYGITYYHKTKEREDGTIEQIDQKHIMRYQQFFAAMVVRQKIAEGVTSGIIWHTQGSGKTALSYHLSYVLTDYFASVNKVTKYYFIVDRLDLMKQAKEEFEARGLVVKTANSRSELMEQFKTNQSQEGTTGEPEITVVNIQRFEERQDKVILFRQKAQRPQLAPSHHPC